mgnify:CR=1 FL=1
MSERGGSPGDDARFLQAVIESLPDAMTLSTAVRDAAGRAVDMRLDYMNAKAREGQPDAQAAIGGLCSELWPGMVENGSFAACMRVLDTGATESGAFNWTESDTYRPAGYDYRAVRVGEDTLLWVLRDNTERLRQEWALAESEARFRAAFEAAPAGMALITADARIAEVNASLARLVRREPEWLVDRTVWDGFALEVDDGAWEALLAGDIEELAGEGDLAAGDGVPVEARVYIRAVRDPEGRPVRLVAHVHDERAARVAALAFAASHDALTRLPNRRLLLERLHAALARREPGLRTALLFLDLDHFKLVNDSLGHLAGDDLLRQVADRLDAALRPGETLARLGGDEFVLLMEEVPEHAWAGEVAQAAARVQRALDGPFEVSGRLVAVTTTVGVAGGGNGDGASAEDLLRDADAALSAAKRHRRGSVLEFDDGMRRDALRRLELSGALRHALGSGEIEVHYQPVVDLDAGHPTAAEALVRWRRPDGRLLLPEEFLGLAEETGLILPLSDQVAAVAAAQLAEWRRGPAPDLGLSLNISPQLLMRTDAVDRIAEALGRAGVPPRAVVLEITEEALVTPTPRMLEALDRLRDEGVRIALDDFGTGYSSLASLRSLPVDMLKVDRAFLTMPGNGHEHGGLLRWFADLSATLGLDVVVEGVEDQADLAAVRAAGLPLAQGFLLGRPMAAAAFAAAHLASPRA